MNNLDVYRKGFVLSLATVLLVFGLRGVSYSQTDSTIGPELSVNHIDDKVIRSVTWIVANDRQGSGVLINRSFRVVVTNLHVTKDSQSIVVFFPVRNYDGNLIVNRKFYVDNLKILTRLGYATEGRIIAKDPEKDLAIVQLSGLPETAREVEYDFSDSPDLKINRNGMVHIFGNPADLKLWRWTLGALQGVDDEGMLRISADIYPGNSGGPVVNSQGMLIGLATRSDQRTDTRAIPTNDIRDLLNTLKPRQIFSIQNKTEFTLYYQIKWTEDDAWKNTTVKQDITVNHWYNGPAEDIPVGYPKIRFDNYTGDQKVTFYTEKLETYTRRLGLGVTPDREKDAREYHFEHNPFTKALTIEDSEKK